MTKPMRTRIFTWDFIMVFLAAGMIRISYQVQSTLMPLYMGQLNFSATTIGVSTSVSVITSLVLRPLLGGLLDRYGRRVFALAGTALFAVSTLLCGFFGGLAVLMALRGLQGLGFSAHTTAVNTMATDILPEDRMSEGIGYMGLTGSVSSAVAPALAMVFAAHADYTAGFGAAFAAGAVAVVSLMLIKSPDVKALPVQTQEKRGFAERFFEKNALRPTVIMMILGICNAGVSTFLAIYTLGKGFNEAQISVYFSVSAVATVIARLSGGWLSRRLGLNKTILAATVLSCVGYILIPNSASAVGLWVAAALQGLSYGTIYPIMNAMAVTKSPPNRRGTAMSTFLAGMDIGIGFGASLWGVIIDAFGMELMFPVCACATFVVYAVFRVLIISRKG